MSRKHKLGMTQARLLANFTDRARFSPGKNGVPHPKMKRMCELGYLSIFKIEEHHWLPKDGEWDWRNRPFYLTDVNLDTHATYYAKVTELGKERLEEYEMSQLLLNDK